jgi:hypothetical protein
VVRQFVLAALCGFLVAEYTRHAGGKATSFYLFTYPTALLGIGKEVSVCAMLLLIMLGVAK